MQLYTFLLLYDYAKYLCHYVKCEKRHQLNIIQNIDFLYIYITDVINIHYAWSKNRAL